MMMFLYDLSMLTNKAGFYLLKTYKLDFLQHFVIKDGIKKIDLLKNLRCKICKFHKMRV